MKILWVCNIVLPDFSEEFGLRKYHNGGWMESMLHQLEKREGVEIAVCCPIIDAWRAKDGVKNGRRYYAFPFSDHEYREKVKERFRVILTDYKPDVVHIWGTEYPHTLAMVNACEELEWLDRTVINLQGFASVCAQHYYADIPEEYRTMTVEEYPSIQENCEDFIFRGRYEIEALKKVRHVIGRTDWDEACTRRVNPEVQYHFCNETLRDEFYQNIGEWSYDACEKYSIFVSQASYPIKGLHYLLKAMPEVLRNYPDTHIYVGGINVMQPHSNGKIQPYGQYILKLIEENHLAGHITFLGQLDAHEMVEQYKSANVFVSASTIENESNSLSEAVLIGCPIVYSLVGGVISRANILGKCAYQHNAEYMLSFYISQIFAKKELLPSCMKMHRVIDRKTNTNTLCEIYNQLGTNGSV